MYRKVNESNRNYIVVDAMGNEDSFAMKMIMNNSIPGIIDFTIRDFNGKISYYYDISGKIPFSQMFHHENDTMQTEDVDRLIESFSHLIHSVEEYFLDFEKINVSSDTCFFDPQTKEYEFIYLPEENIQFDFKSGLKEIWEKVIEKFDHSSKMEDLIRIYEIYQRTCIGNPDISTIFKTNKYTEKKDVFRNCKNLKEVKEKSINKQRQVGEYKNYFDCKEEDEFFGGRKSYVSDEAVFCKNNYEDKSEVNQNKPFPDVHNGFFERGKYTDKNAVALEQEDSKETLKKNIRFILPIIIACTILVIVILSMS